MERQWTITHLSVFKDGEMNAYLEAICDTEAQAKQLLQDIYDDAARKFRSRRTGAVYSDPKWLDEEHEKLQIKLTASAVYTNDISYTETYFVSYIWKERTYNPKWILE